jgi:hypothetical protein
MLLIEGAWYCPSIPAVLTNATIEYEAGLIDELTNHARLAERWRYLVLTKVGPDDGGHSRVRCPASSPNPVARCELKPASVRRSTQGRLRIPLEADIATRPPKICSQQSITPPRRRGEVCPGASLPKRSVEIGVQHLAQLDRGLQRIREGRQP